MRSRQLGSICEYQNRSCLSDMLKLDWFIGGQIALSHVSVALMFRVFLVSVCSFARALCVTAAERVRIDPEWHLAVSNRSAIGRCPAGVALAGRFLPAADSGSGIMAGAGNRRT